MYIRNAVMIFGFLTALYGILAELMANGLMINDKTHKPAFPLGCPVSQGAAMPLLREEALIINY
ncbi:MAG: hypothetical protein CRN43_01035 [Candidatus Nephrothrix sp. EaCA]|nr:MAG: hypothetical protein CRN43_01035 [Candidatus Nephrothrix sp. EaCA]